MSLETAFTTLYHKVETSTSPTNSQTSSVDIENKILKLETGFNASISNISTAVDNLLNTQLNVNNMMAYFDRNMVNISLTVNNILQQQNNISTCVDTENRILKLETGFNASISNVSTTIDKLIHTQFDVNNKMAIFERNMNNISSTVNNILQQQNNNSACVDTENKIMKLETRFNVSISNVTTLIENISHTQLNVTKMMAYFDRNLNNISSSVENLRITQQQIMMLQHAYNNIQGTYINNCLTKVTLLV